MLDLLQVWPEVHVLEILLFPLIHRGAQGHYVASTV